MSGKVDQNIYFVPADSLGHFHQIFSGQTTIHKAAALQAVGEGVLLVLQCIEISAGIAHVQTRHQRLIKPRRSAVTEVRGDKADTQAAMGCHLSYRQEFFFPVKLLIKLMLLP